MGNPVRHVMQMPRGSSLLASELDPRSRPGVGPEDLELDLFLTLVLLSSYNLTSLDQVHEPPKVENCGHRFSNTYATFPLPLSYFNPGKGFIDKDFLPSKRQS